MTTAPPTGQPTDQPRPVDALAEAFVEEWAALDPVGATEAGLEGHDHELTDLSPEGHAARADLVRRTLAALGSVTPVDDRERAAQEAFGERLAVTAERDEAGVPRFEVSVISSALHDLRGCFDLMDTSTPDGWEAVDRRLAGVGAALEGYRATLCQAAARGLVSSRRQYVEIAAQVDGWTGGPGGRGVLLDLVASAPEDSRASLEPNAGTATEALASFGRFLLREMAPAGREADAVGPEHYALASRYFLGTEVDLAETYAWGWEELHRIETEMRHIARRLVPGATIEEAAAHLDADPSRVVEGKEAFRDWMQQLADRTLAGLSGSEFDIPEPVRRIECRIAPTEDGGIYYTGPSEDFSRPGRMWWSVPRGVTRFSPWREVTTVFHEGVPGHHLQVGQTCFRSDRLNRWQRQLCWVSGSGEGWALYAERLMGELGHLEDPADRLGMLDAQALRAARVVVDIGLHLDLAIPEGNPFGFHPGGRWDADRVLEFLRAHTRLDDETLRFESLRYLGWPGQAPSYKVGERIWLQAREDARARHGAAFDLKAFHRAALDLGSVGLDPLVAGLGRL